MGPVWLFISSEPFADPTIKVNYDFDLSDYFYTATNLFALPI